MLALQKVKRAGLIGELKDWESQRPCFTWVLASSWAFPSARLGSRDLAVQALLRGGEGVWWGLGGQVLQRAAWGHRTATQGLSPQ